LRLRGFPGDADFIGADAQRVTVMELDILILRE